MIQELNTSLLVWFHSLMQIAFVEDIVYIFADLPIFFLPVFLVFVWLRNLKDSEVKTKLLSITYACIIGIGVSLLIQQFVDIARPESALTGSTKLILSHIPDASFPSDHATVSVAFLASLFWAGYQGVGYSFLIFVIIMNLSRIIAGVHWPLDIMAGTLVGIASSWLVFQVISGFEVVKKLNLFIIKLASYFKL